MFQNFLYELQLNIKFIYFGKDRRPLTTLHSFAVDFITVTCI